ncbi:MAG: ABC transporter permease [Mesorhizobium sp.]|uniref:ABC transporter permease n=1 Tax=Mesorhizobium sp. TaxID=1871066 RepID=UPI000FE876A5|nr:ABC transporter permease [Mesorhizobium sp.]RWB28299.1 MAG: ABC transporter permease [Mesorhizobium sp.]RWB83350.1 MAG: ABC transporter permease [Mesorhizobium sp.]RWF73520.1 MAG: ABC transporter permease [Mesorhizobium sp.]TIS62781.1 MAG: ABC transporter permease [Mesorhizobium sp.]
MSGGRAWTPEFSLKFLILPPLLFLVPTFLLPLGIVVYRSVDGLAFDLRQFAEIFSNSTYLYVLSQTFKTAVMSTFLALLIGFPIAHVICNARRFWAGIAFACVMVPLWTSVVTRTYAWIALLGRRGLVNQMLIDTGVIDQALPLMYNPLAVQVGMVQVLLPMMILPVLSSMRQMDRTKLMASAILGANPVRTFIHIYVPMCLPGIMAGSVLVFITALGFYVTPALLGGDSNMMIAVLIEQQVTKTLNWPLASALATVLLMMVLLTLLLVWQLARLRGVRLGVA